MLFMRMHTFKIGGKLIHSVFLCQILSIYGFMVDLINVYQYCSSKVFAHFPPLATR